MIELSMVRLINWYAFNNITAPFGKFTLVAGRNGNGKIRFSINPQRIKEAVLLHHIPEDC